MKHSKELDSPEDSTTFYSYNEIQSISSESWDLESTAENSSYIFQNSSNVTDAVLQDHRSHLYRHIVPILLIACVLSLCINIRVLICIYWIRRPLSPTLHISLSLAAADAYTSFLLGVGLFINSLLPYGLGIESGRCFPLVIETLRISGIIITVLHLLSLAINHYLGILRPLHYLSLMTYRKTSISNALLWILPNVFFFTYFASVEGDGFQSELCTYEFLKKRKFRIVFSSWFFGPLFLMLVIYVHIFIIVQQHQSDSGGTFGQGSRHRHSSNGTGVVGTSSRQQSIAPNVKAICTTLYILGSFIIGWLPALLMFLLFCDDCQYPLSNSHDRSVMVLVYSFANLLIIVKTALNPVIYAARMHEIKMAIPRMQASLCGCCPCCIDAEGSEQLRYRTSQYYNSSNTVLTRSNTTVCRLNSNSNSAQRSSTRSNHGRWRNECSTEL